MSRDVVRAFPGEDIGEARDRLLARHLRAMPVVDADQRVVGVVGHAQLSAGGGRCVGDVMIEAPYCAAPETPIDALLPALSGGDAHEAFIVESTGRLAGMITQTDLLAALWRGHVAERVALAAAAAA